MNTFYDAIVIGGGVNGGSIAYNLAKRGKKVLLLEKDRLVGKASSAAAGMLGAQAELDGEGPLFQLARQSRQLFPVLAEEIKTLSGIDIGLINKGMLKVAQTEEEVKQYKRIIELQRAAGEQADWMSGEEVRKKETALADDILGAIYMKKDGQVSAPDLAMGLLKSAAALGADIKEHIEVYSFQKDQQQITGVVTNQGCFSSEHVIVAGGAWSEKLLAETNLSLETFPVKGECFSVLTHQPILSCTIFSHGCYIVPKRGGRLIVGATQVPHSFDTTVTVEGVSLLMEKAKRLVPSIVDAEWEKAWAGTRPQTGDGLPYLGEHPVYKGLFVATGHFRNGILLSPITGIIVADLVERQTPSVELTPFQPGRNTMLHA